MYSSTEFFKKEFEKDRAKVSVFETNHRYDDNISYGASALSAGVYGGNDRNRGLGIDASVVRAETNLGRVSAGVGLNFDTGALVGRDGVGLSLLGFGFKLGHESKIKTPLFDIGFKF
jgi:hypothetical protein